MQTLQNRTLSRKVVAKSQNPRNGAALFPVGFALDGERVAGQKLGFAAINALQPFSFGQ